jgi:hypothetical protein
MHSRNRIIGRLFGALPGVPEGCLGAGIELEDVGRLTGLFPGRAGGTVAHLEMTALVLGTEAG